MTFGLDYDGTYTADPVLWNYFIAQASRRGHDVICVTSRVLPKNVMMAIPVCCTAGKAKVKWCRDRGIRIDVWIDDMPVRLVEDVPLEFRDKHSETQAQLARRARGD